METLIYNFPTFAEGSVGCMGYSEEGDFTYAFGLCCTDGEGGGYFSNGYAEGNGFGCFIEAGHHNSYGHGYGDELLIWVW